MYEQIDVARHRDRPPALINTLTELPRALFEAGSLCTMLPSLSLLKRGDPHPTLLIPGFMAGDASLGLLKRYLQHMGYQPETWGYGRNTGNPEHLFDHLPEKLARMYETTGKSISLIGQSLGGVYARELAREYPRMVRQVITLGSPFKVRNSSTTMRALTHLFKASSGMTIDEMVELMRDRAFHESPNVPVTAVYSRGDGVVHWDACRETVEDHHTQNIEVPGSHCGMGFNPAIYYIIADRLAQRDENWQKFSWTGHGFRSC
ncbi:MAG: esterase [Pseudomonadales bacterium]|nr:esterase [Pseudomonadales bacterium]MBO6704090.1 esterase [Pseudomonadales bacterium]MBO7006314.1 esterase [Pseudomonadales bacterium]